MPRRPEVQHTKEFERVAALPRRVPDPAEAELWAEILTERLRAPRSKATVRPWQGYAYAEIMQAPPGRGAVLWLGVGAGKTWITYTAPMAAMAERPLMILSATLIEKTWHDFGQYRGVWKAPDHPWRIIGQEWLRREENVGFLEEYRPDLVVLDESDEFANWKRGAPLVIEHYWRKHPEARFVALTATPERWSIMDFWHVMRWCLREGCPLPLREAEARLWAACFDERIRNPAARPMPGPLGANHDRAREWLRKRIFETPGVLIVDGDSCDQPLLIETRLAREDPVLDKHFDVLRTRMESPGGEPVDIPLTQYLLEGQLGCGLYSRYKKPPPIRWRLANRGRAKLVREVIDQSARTGVPLFTEAPILRRYANHPAVVEWLAVKDTFEPEMETIWLSDSTVRSALDWLAESPEPGIVWCGSVDFGQALATAARLPYYGSRGRCDGGGSIIHADRTRSFVASWQANMKGKNLQPWSRQLIIMPPQSAKWLEQIYGRSHRSGADRPVRVTILLTSGGTIDLFETAIREAKSARGIVSLTQKVLHAQIKRARPRITPSNQLRWASREKVSA